MKNKYQHDLLNDKFLNDFVFEGKENGYFVEIGALDGLVCSQTYFLEKEKNWNGIVVEPNSYWHENLSNFRDCHIETNPILDVEKEIKFLRHLKQPEYSKILSDNNEKTEFPKGDTDEVILKSTTLSNLLKKFNAPKTIDVLAIDIEGHELNVLKEFFKNSKIKVNTIILEWGYHQTIENFFYDTPYIQIKNPLLHFVKIDRKRDIIVRWQYNEWVGLDKKIYSDSEVKDLEEVDWEYYFVHIDLLKEYPNLKKLIIPTTYKAYSK
jgi:FkbM family methyltransferase